MHIARFTVRPRQLIGILNSHRLFCSRHQRLNGRSSASIHAPLGATLVVWALAPDVPTLFTVRL